MNLSLNFGNRLPALSREASLFYGASLEAAWETASSTPAAAFWARRRAGFRVGIIMTATAPAAAPMAMEETIAKPFIAFTSFRP